VNSVLEDVIRSKIDRDIIIIGKGPSIDHIDIEKLAPSIIINLNDSEIILPGDICIFHDSWVLDYFKVSKPKCSVYISDKKMDGEVRQIICDFVPYNPESAQFQINRFFSDGITIEQSLLITALRVADEIGRISRMTKNVYLLGFDFTAKSGYTKKIVSAAQHFMPEYQEQMIASQERSLLKILSKKDSLSVTVKHIGERPYSDFSVSEFNQIFASHESNGSVYSPKKRLAIENAQVVSVVAEITTNHLGDMERVFRMIELAHEAGADYVKFQKRDVETFYTEEQLKQPYESPFGDTFRDYRHGIELNESQFESIADFCDDIGIKWFASILDLKSYEFMKKFSPEMVKLPSTISEHKDFLSHVAADFKHDVVISTGYTDKAFEAFLIDSFTRCRKLYLLQCTSAYPTPLEDAQVGVVRHYSNLSRQDARIRSGYSSHDIGSTCSMMAVAAGASMIEKHVKLGAVGWSHFDEVALDLASGEFKSFVEDVRLAELITGGQNKTVKQSEHHKYWLASDGLS